MNSGLDTKSIWKTYLVRGVAVLFLLFIGVDLAFPQCCAGDSGNLSFVGRTTVNSSRTDAAQPDSLAVFNASGSSRQGNQPNRMPAQEQHCITCCAHILPIVISLAAVPAIPMTSTFDLRHDALPVSPPQSLFRPPRHA